MAHINLVLANTLILLCMCMNRSGVIWGTRPVRLLNNTSMFFFMNLCAFSNGTVGIS